MTGQHYFGQPRARESTLFCHNFQVKKLRWWNQLSKYNHQSQYNIVHFTKQLKNHYHSFWKIKLSTESTADMRAIPITRELVLSFGEGRGQSQGQYWGRGPWGWRNPRTGWGEAAQYDLGHWHLCTEGLRSDRLLTSLISTLPCDPNTCSFPVISSTSGFPKESSHLSLYMQSLCLTRSPPLPLRLLPFNLSTQSKDTSFGSWPCSRNTLDYLVIAVLTGSIVSPLPRLEGAEGEWDPSSPGIWHPSENVRELNEWMCHCPHTGRPW